jgi:hypothetical protein
MHLTIGCNGHDTVSLAMHAHAALSGMIQRVGMPDRNVSSSRRVRCT